jgi:hypothetical protein
MFGLSQRDDTLRPAFVVYDSNYLEYHLSTNLASAYIIYRRHRITRVLVGYVDGEESSVCVSSLVISPLYMSWAA